VYKILLLLLSSSSLLFLPLKYICILLTQKEPTLCLRLIKKTHERRWLSLRIYSDSSLLLLLLRSFKSHLSLSPSPPRQTSNFITMTTNMNVKRIIMLSITQPCSNM